MLERSEASGGGVGIDICTFLHLGQLLVKSELFDVLFIMRPHSQYLDGLDFFDYLINKTVLDVNSA